MPIILKINKAIMVVAMTMIMRVVLILIRIGDTETVSVAEKNTAAEI